MIIFAAAIAFLLGLFVGGVGVILYFGGHLMMTHEQINDVRALLSWSNQP